MAASLKTTVTSPEGAKQEGSGTCPAQGGEPLCVFITEPGSLPDTVPALGHRGLSKPGTRKELSKRAKKT